jgi:hypothetical protein
MRRRGQSEKLSIEGVFSMLDAQCAIFLDCRDGDHTVKVTIFQSEFLLLSDPLRLF